MPSALVKQRSLKALTPEQTKNLRDVFDGIDTDGSDDLDYTEVRPRRNLIVMPLSRNLASTTVSLIPHDASVDLSPAAEGCARFQWSGDLAKGAEGAVGCC